MVMHEVLLAMVGKGGALISISASEAKVRGEAEFLLEQERELITRAAGIGRSFFILEDFTRRVRAGGKGLREGLYIRALAAGIDEVLAVYRSMVLELEREVLSDATTPLTRIETATSDWELLLPALCKIAGALESGDVHGCKILDLVAEHSTSGVPAVRGVAERLLARLGIVLYSQLGAWVMHGLLTDPNNEFFIQASSSSSSSPSSHPQATDGEDEVALAALDDDETFTVCPERRPACVSPAVVERVLFSGVALRIMLGPKATDEDRPEEAKMAAFRREIQAMASQPVFHRASFETLVNSLQSHASQRLYRLVVVRARLPLHLQAMKDYLLLGRGDLFQAFIENTRGLLGLTSGQGGEHDVNEPYRRAALLSYADEDEMFGRTRMMVEEGGGDAKDGKGEALDALRMRFDFDWPLGTLLFTQEVMARYNLLFTFLLRVKRAQAELQYAWLETQSGKHGRMMSSTARMQTQSGRHLTAMWAMRSEMAFLVENLTYYLQCDVIDSQYDKVKGVVSGSHDFEAIRVAHARFLSTVSVECLTTNKLAFQTVNKLLKIALSFARGMCRLKTVEKGTIEEAFPPSLKKFRLSDSASDEQGAYAGFPISINGEANAVAEYSSDRVVTLAVPLRFAISGDSQVCSEDAIGASYTIQAPSVSPSELADITQQFRRNALLLFTVLKASQSHSTPVLSQLLFKLDFNRFFENQQTKWQQQHPKP